MSATYTGINARIANLSEYFFFDVRVSNIARHTNIKRNIIRIEV
jgi:hypothetical protein